MALNQYKSTDDCLRQCSSYSFALREPLTFHVYMEYTRVVHKRWTIIPQHCC